MPSYSPFIGKIPYAVLSILSNSLRCEEWDAARSHATGEQMSTTAPAIPPDDSTRNLTLAHPDNLPHIGLVGDTYTVTVTGEDTAGRFCVVDMHIPPGGGPPPHRHDFEETFILLEGEMEATFRGEKTTVKAGETVTIPANAPHRFQNVSSQAVRLICICSP